jgi:hypothetical protein
MSLRARTPGASGNNLSGSEMRADGAGGGAGGASGGGSGGATSSGGPAYAVDVEGGGAGAHAMLTSGGASVAGLHGGAPWGGASSPPTPAPSPAMYAQAAAANTALGLVLSMMVGDSRYAVIILALCVDGLIFSKYLSDWLLSKDDGTPEMRAVADPIREGSQAFLRVQYGAIARLAVVVAGIIFLSYQLRPSDMGGGISNLSSFTLGVIGAASFVVGALCSAAAGYVSMHIAAATNIRVTSAARRGYAEALAICFRGGAFSAILVLALCVLGVTLLHMLLTALFVGPPGSGSLTPADVPMLCVGYGFGASFVALFMQLGGGIYTKVRRHRGQRQGALAAATAAAA